MTSSGTIDLESLCANGFRVLGVSGSASQAAIIMAARRMRIWPDEKSIPPTPWDCRWIGSLSRSRPALQQAVARLSEPGTRIADRMLWYVGQQPPQVAAPTSQEVARASPVERHGIAIGDLHRAMAQDPLVGDVARWGAVLSEVIDWAASDRCTELVRQIESDGGFDKRASEEEITSAIASLPRVLIAWLTDAAVALLASDGPRRSERILRMIQEIARLGTPPERDDVAQRLEDHIFNTCAKLDREMRERLSAIQSNPTLRSVGNVVVVARSVANRCADRVEPAVEQLRWFVEPRCARMARVNSMAADLLFLIAAGWEWAGRFILAEEALTTAAKLTQDLPGHWRIRQTLDRVKVLSDGERKLPPPLKLWDTTVKPQQPQIREQPGPQPKDKNREK
jgi:hypothetical protein